MSVKSILDEKGRDVATLLPDATVSDAIAALAKLKIGALVITDADNHIQGILSERDIVRGLAANSPEIMTSPVSKHMTDTVKVCSESNSVHDLMEIMTTGRFRHLPVETDGKLAGIISIGDVVKRRIEEVEREADEIRNYITSA